MRSSHPVLLALASAAAATPLSDFTSLCIRAQSMQVESLVTCGDGPAFADCVNQLVGNLEAADVEACLAASGCSDELAAVGAETLVVACKAVENGNNGDLRRRHGAAEYTAHEVQQLSTPAIKEAEAPAKRTDVPKVNVVPRADTTTSSTKARPSDDECWDTTTSTQKNVCSVVDGENECKDVPVAKKKCREGWLCRVDEMGSTACMESHDVPDTSGIIIAIIFAAAIVVALGMMTFFCCKDKREQKKLAAKAEAAAIAKASNVGKKARNVSDRQPLMAAGPSSPGPSPYGGEQPNPFGDQGARY